MALGFSECLSMKAECATFWAGWGVIATGAVGVITVVVAVLAWLTSRRAARIADEATRIAAQQHADTIRVKGETARIIGRLLVNEMGTIPPRAARVARAMSRAERYDDAESSLVLAKYYDQAIYEARQDFLPTAEHVLDRIHALPDALGADLATLIAACRSLRAISARLEDKTGRITKFKFGDGTNYVKLNDALADWISLRQQALWILRIGAQYSNEFRSFVGIPPADYGHNLEEFPNWEGEQAHDSTAID